MDLYWSGSLAHGINPVWLRRLAPFGVQARMALTNYMIQIAILDLTFSNYAFGASIRAAWAPVAAALLFAVEATCSRLWLARYCYGPLEWIWRTATYARWQPLRRVATSNADCRPSPGPGPFLTCLNLHA